MNPQKRRRFRFSLRTLLIVFVVLGVGLGWWIDTPRRTFRRFHALIVDGRFAEADRMLVRPSKIQVCDNVVFFNSGGLTGSNCGSRTDVQHHFDSTSVTLLPLSFSDILRRRRFF